MNGIDAKGKTALSLACAAGNKVVAEALLSANADPNIASQSGNTALHAAAYIGHIGIVTALLDAGADKSLADKEGSTPAKDAESGASLTSRDSHDDPERGKYPEVIALLQ